MKVSAKERARAARLMLLFRITPGEQAAILRYEKKDPVLRQLVSNHLGTDHDHTTGLIRGMLDWKINRALGMIEAAVPDPKKVPGALRALAAYYEHPPATAVLGAPRYGLIGKAKRKKRMIYGPPQT